MKKLTKIRCIQIKTADGKEVYPLHRKTAILYALQFTKDYPECLDGSKPFTIVDLTRKQWDRAKKIGKELS